MSICRFVQRDSVPAVSRYRTIDDLDARGKRVLVRTDLNVPLEEGTVTDDFRVRSALPTIHRLRTEGATVVLASHLGRPNGREEQFSLKPVAEKLSELGGFPVVLADDYDDFPEPGDGVILLENTRFHEGETSNEPALAQAFASTADAFVLDAFGSAHRAHASTVGVTEHLPSYVGPLIESELAAMDRLLIDPARPFVVLLGGAKVSSKLGVMRALLPKVDAMLVGGGMCFTLLQAEGHEVGNSLVEEDMVAEVGEVLGGDYGSRVELPSDIVVADRFSADAAAETHRATELPDDGYGLDIGPGTAERFGDIIRGAASVFWNGPMGVFEWERFRAGTESIARAIAESDAYSVVGGGDSAAALKILGLENAVSHLSTGGGAGLEYLEEGTLPALDAVAKWTDRSTND